MVKTVNLLRYLSIFIFFIALAVVYAYLPVMVNLYPADSSFSMHKEDFFYFIAGAFMLINGFSWFFYKLMVPRVMSSRGESAAAWTAAVPVIINAYLATLIGFIGVLNNAQHLKTSGFAYLNFIGPVIIFIWICGSIYFLIKPK